MILSDWPVPMRSDWIDVLNEPQTEKELAALRQCADREVPYGKEAWTKKISKELGWNLPIACIES